MTEKNWQNSGNFRRGAGTKLHVLKEHPYAFEEVCFGVFVCV